MLYYYIYKCNNVNSVATQLKCEHQKTKKAAYDEKVVLGPLSFKWKEKTHK